MLSEKERLDEELRFLKESLHIGVITQEEYDVAQKRVENKLSALSDEKVFGEKTTSEYEKEIQSKKSDTEESQSQLKTEETKSSDIQAVNQDMSDKKEKDDFDKDLKRETKYVSLGELGKEEKISDESKEEEKEIEREDSVDVTKKEEDEEIYVEAKPYQEKNNEIPITDDSKVDVYFEDDKGNKRIFAYIGIIIVVSLGLWYFFSLGSSEIDKGGNGVDVVSLIECSSDEDCKKKGKIGICEDSGLENAECNYIEDVEISLKVLNSKKCFNCDTARVLSILRDFYPNINVENIDIETEAGKDLAEKFDLNLLPAYIMDSKLEEAYNYDKLSNTFTKVDDDFIMKNTAANSNYYFTRENVPNKLDLFVQRNHGASLRAGKNIEEFLELFDDKIEFKTYDSDSRIARELGINTFPAFLINNKLKFSGVQPANKVKENFCKLNDLDECGQKLSENLV